MTTLSLQDLPAFRNEPLTDFHDPAQRQAMTEALAKVQSELGRRYPMIIGGQEIYLDETENSINPARPWEVVGVFPKGGVEHVNLALDAATQAFQTWQYTPADQRAKYLVDAAAEIRRRKHELSAWMVFEAGKSWVEADADTAECIDFLEYYARQMLRLAQPVELAPFEGEEDALQYIPLGAGAVIPPWNFPAAIPGGMSAAAIVAGNTVVLKPAPTTPTIAWHFHRVMTDVGLPPGVFNIITGPGPVLGDALVDHPKTRFIAFTGSVPTGLRIHERAAKVHPGQLWIKRTVLEMGGKDAVLVDETADLDEAAKGIVASAFGFQGQKCSAGSRAIIHAAVYDTLVDRILHEAQKLTVGDPAEPSTYMGPVIDERAYEKVRHYINLGKHEGRLLTGGETYGPGYFIEPTIFADVPPDAKVAQDEIFGPVLAIIKAKDWEDMLRIANGTIYGLTGAVYSKDESRLEDAARRYHVGNLYLNRKCTGAMVGVHPFGGFNMSGTDTKSGGPDYLLHFTQAKSIARKIVPEKAVAGTEG